MDIWARKYCVLLGDSRAIMRKWGGAFSNQGVWFSSFIDQIHQPWILKLDLHNMNISEDDEISNSLFYLINYMPNKVGLCENIGIPFTRWWMTWLLAELDVCTCVIYLTAQSTTMILSIQSYLRYTKSSFVFVKLMSLQFCNQKQNLSSKPRMIATSNHFVMKRKGSKEFPFR